MSTKIADVFSGRLRQRREELGMSQSQLAQAIGREASTVNHLEMGRRLPSIETLCAIAESLHITVDSLLGRQDTAQPGAGPGTDKLLHVAGGLGDSDMALLVAIAQEIARHRKTRQ